MIAINFETACAFSSIFSCIFAATWPTISIAYYSLEAKKIAIFPNATAAAVVEVTHSNISDRA